MHSSGNILVRFYHRFHNKLFLIHFLRTLRNRLTFLSQSLTRCVWRNEISRKHTSNKKFKISFSEWLEVKVFILKSEAVINDQNHILWRNVFHETAYKIQQLKNLKPPFSNDLKSKFVSWNLKQLLTIKILSPFFWYTLCTLL